MRLAVAILVLLIASAMGLWRLDTESVWHDEAWSIRAIDDPIGTPDDNTPPLYYAVMHLYTHQMGAGESPFALRYGSVLFFLLLVAVGFRVAERWYGLFAATMAAILLATSPLLWQYAQEVRAYIVVPLIALLLLAASDYLLQHQTISRRAWLFIFGIELAGLYSHNLAVPIVAWFNVILIGIWGLRWLRGHKGSLQKLMLWLGGQAALLVLYLPWVLSLAPSGSSINTVPVFGRELSQDLWRGYIFPVIANPDDLPDDFLTVVHLLPILAGISVILLLWQGRSLRSLLIFSQVTLLPIFSTVLLIRASIDFHPRYYILAVPATLLLLVLAAASLPRWPRYAVGSTFVGVCLYISAYTLGYIADHPRYQNDDFATLVDYYAELPEDAAILVPYDDEPTLTHYFRGDFDAQVALLPEDATPQEALRAIEPLAGQHIEVLTWFQNPADLRGMLGCLVGASAQRQGETFQAQGLQSVAYQMQATPQDPRLLSHSFTVEAPLKLSESVQVLQSELGVCVFANWLGNHDEPQDLQLAGRIYNAFGWQLTSVDVPILADDQSQPSEFGRSFAFFRLPDGAPAGDYDVVWRVYNDENPSGFDVSVAGESRGKDMRFTVDYAGNAFDESLTVPMLTQDNAQDGIIWNRLEAELLIPASDAEQTLMLTGSDWEIETALTRSADGIVWQSMDLPSDAAGQAHLRIGDLLLASYRIGEIEAKFEAPQFDSQIGVNFGELLTLAGATVAQEDNSIQIDLIWRVEQTPDQAYIAFAQLLDEDGRLLAGSDTPPTDRPFFTWQVGEYFSNSHRIHLDTVNYSGQTTIIAGVYAQDDFQRLRLDNGADFVQVPVEIEVQD